MATSLFGISSSPYFFFNLDSIASIMDTVMKGPFAKEEGGLRINWQRQCSAVWWWYHVVKLEGPQQRHQTWRKLPSSYTRIPKCAISHRTLFSAIQRGMSDQPNPYFPRFRCDEYPNVLIEMLREPHSLAAREREIHTTSLLK